MWIKGEDGVSRLQTVIVKLPPKKKREPRSTLTVSQARSWTTISKVMESILLVSPYHGAGLHFDYAPEGWTVKRIEDLPGQPGLKVKDLMTHIGGDSLVGLKAKKQVKIFKKRFADAIKLTIVRKEKVAVKTDEDIREETRRAKQLRESTEEAKLGARMFDQLKVYDKEISKDEYWDEELGQWDFHALRDDLRLSQKEATKKKFAMLQEKKKEVRKEPPPNETWQEKLKRMASERKEAEELQRQAEAEVATDENRIMVVHGETRFKTDENGDPQFVYDPKARRWAPVEEVYERKQFHKIVADTPIMPTRDDPLHPEIVTLIPAKDIINLSKAQLRRQLEKRGCDSTGSKPNMAHRLMNHENVRSEKYGAFYHIDEEFTLWLHNHTGTDQFMHEKQRDFGKEDRMLMMQAGSKHRGLTGNHAVDNMVGDSKDQHVGVADRLPQNPHYEYR